MERCRHCEQPILPRDLVWQEVQTAHATFWSPAEYEEIPLHAHCQLVVNSEAYREHLDEQRALRGLSNAERERV